MLALNTHTSHISNWSPIEQSVTVLTFNYRK